MILKAIKFATKAHEGQTRKDGKTPFITHPLRVAFDLAMRPECTERLLIAAVLHDTIEDTWVRYSDIEREFGTEIAQLVLALTNPSKGSNAPRAKRKEQDREHLRHATSEIKLIKLIDRLDNLRDLHLDDKFGLLYAEESLSILEVLKGTNAELEQLIADRCGEIQTYWLNKFQETCMGYIC